MASHRLRATAYQRPPLPPSHAVHGRARRGVPRQLEPRLQDHEGRPHQVAGVLQHRGVKAGRAQRGACSSSSSRRRGQGRAAKRSLLGGHIRATAVATDPVEGYLRCVAAYYVGRALSALRAAGPPAFLVVGLPTRRVVTHALWGHQFFVLDVLVAGSDCAAQALCLIRTWQIQWCSWPAPVN